MSRVHAGRTATNTYDFASVLTVAGDDPVNEGDPTGMNTVTEARVLVDRFNDEHNMPPHVFAQSRNVRPE